MVPLVMIQFYGLIYICTKTNKLLIKSMKGISTLKRLMQQIETIWVNNIDPYTWPS